jgi:hypothetical protein
MYPVNATVVDDTVFLRILSCWGWATWRRAWVFYSDDLVPFMNNLSKGSVRRRFDALGHAPFSDQLVANFNGTKKTWAVRWYASWFFRDGYSLFPCSTLIRNIGHDGSGVNSGLSSAYESAVIANYISVRAKSVTESTKYLKSIDAFYAVLTRHKRTFYKSVKRSWLKLKANIYRILSLVLN